MSLCKDCYYSQKIALDFIRCNNPKVNKRNSVFLATGSDGIYCNEERKKSFIHISGWLGGLEGDPLVYISACGRRGAQFKPKPTQQPDAFSINHCECKK